MMRKWKGKGRPVLGNSFIFLCPLKIPPPIKQAFYKAAAYSVKRRYGDVKKRTHFRGEAEVLGIIPRMKKNEAKTKRENTGR